jgi:hypothetical protein
MDRFDELIKTSYKDKQPSDNFVDTTMQKIEVLQTRKNFKWRLWKPALGSAIAVIALVVIILPKGTTNLSSESAASHSTPKTAVASNSQVSAQSASSGGGSPSKAQPVSSGTDNASLESDVNSISNSFNQEANDQNAANTALNDTQQEINIPTN